jgi:hypothetical protein
MVQKLKEHTQKFLTWQDAATRMFGESPDESNRSRWPNFLTWQDAAKQHIEIKTNHNRNSKHAHFL